MPAHSVSASDLAREVEKIEAAGGKIIAVAPAGDGAFVVVTAPRRSAPGPQETR